MDNGVKTTGSQSVANPVGDFDQVSFNPEAFDSFIIGNSVSLEHYAAIPSPIGLKERGDVRRSEILDTLESNGLLYKKMGSFNAAFLSNSHNKSDIDGGMIDSSTARITMPRFYNDGTKTIHLSAGDKLYIKDLEIKIANFQRMEYNGKIADFLQFPALEVEFLVDSLGREYTQGKEFILDKNGNISHLIDTGKDILFCFIWFYIFRAI